MCRQVVVQWTTRDVGNNPIAQVGTASGQYSQTAAAVSNTYARSLMVGPPANTVGYFDPVSPLLQPCSATSTLSCQLRTRRLSERNEKGLVPLCGSIRAPQQYRPLPCIHPEDQFTGMSHFKGIACWVQGSLHYATLTGLAPNTKYYYRYGDIISQLFSPEYSFTTPPLPGAGTTVKFLAWADAGQAVADGTNEYDYYDVSFRAATMTERIVPLL